MNNSRFLMPGLTTILISLLIISSCSSKKEQQQAEPIAVRVETVSNEGKIDKQEYIGIVESDKAVDVSFLVPGNIEQTYAYEGQRVARGQLLARLNTTTLRNAYGLSLVTLKQAEDAFRRLSAMHQENSLPEIQYVDVKTKLEMAKANEAIAKKNLQDCNIYAPQSGVVGKLYFESGTNVMPGSPVYTVMDNSNIKVKVAIPEGEISGIHQGARAKVVVSALNNSVFEGTLVEKGVVANPVSHTYDVKIKIKNPSGQIIPGMVCRAYLGNLTGSLSGRIVIPIKSVQVDYSGKRFVWLKDKNSRAIRQEVELGNLSENGIEIITGLHKGDKLIIAGYQNIGNGTLVAANN